MDAVTSHASCEHKSCPLLVARVEYTWRRSLSIVHEALAVRRNKTTTCRTVRTFSEVDSSVYHSLCCSERCNPMHLPHMTRCHSLDAKVRVYLFATRLRDVFNSQYLPRKELYPVEGKPGMIVPLVFKTNKATLVCLCLRTVLRMRPRVR